MRFALNGISIHNFNPKKIEQNFNDTEILDQFRDDSLSEWLEEVGEDDMANRIKALDKKSSDDELIDAIIGIMGLDRKQLEDTRNRIAAERAVAQKAEMEKLEAEREAKRTVRERESLPDYDKVPDRSIYFEKWKQAAESGDMRAQYNYGMCCENAYEKRKWIEQSAEQGYEKAQEQLEYLNEWRIGIPIVSPWVKDGDVEAQEDEKLPDYGEVENPGDYFDKWHDAAVCGDVRAQYNLGLCYILPCEELLDDYDPSKGIEWIGKAAANGYDKAKDLATLDIDGLRQILLDLANQGDATAQFLVAENFYYGQNGFRENEKSAIKWWKKAAEQGYEGAIRRLNEIEEDECGYSNYANFEPNKRHDVRVPKELQTVAAKVVEEGVKYGVKKIKSFLGM